MEQIAASGIEDYIQIDTVRSMMNRHRNGQGDYARRIWTIYMFALWHFTYMEESPKQALSHSVVKNTANQGLPVSKGGVKPGIGGWMVNGRKAI
ncbi:hypothetical protein LJK88_09725 [Paenibacillus sp. P26]|nr:hypothetical protein LJK88_09725 [Paenibacillus sp. P26]